MWTPVCSGWCAGTNSCSDTFVRARTAIDACVHQAGTRMSVNCCMYMYTNDRFLHQYPCLYRTFHSNSMFALIQYTCFRVNSCIFLYIHGYLAKFVHEP